LNKIENDFNVNINEKKASSANKKNEIRVRFGEIQKQIEKKELKFY
jgi:hypothetical protein